MDQISAENNKFQPIHHKKKILPQIEGKKGVKMAKKVLINEQF